MGDPVGGVGGKRAKDLGGEPDGHLGERSSGEPDGHLGERSGGEPGERPSGAWGVKAQAVPRHAARLGRSAGVV
ncbi:hypothetical protein GCM10023085_50840 [Actinomadura viridis]